jgi:hypothetical protein
MSTPEKEAGAHRRRPRRGRRRLALLFAPVAIFALLATYVGVQSTQSADAAVVTPTDCESLESFALKFVNTLASAQETIEADVRTMNNNGPNATGLAAALRLDGNVTVDLPEYQDQQDTVDNQNEILDCDSEGFPSLESSVVRSAEELTTIQSDLETAEDTITETIVSEEDGYDPCEDTASVQAAPVDGAGSNTHSAGTLAGNVVQVDLSESKYPESTQHIKDAIAAGAPRVLTLDRNDPPGTASKDKKCNKRRKLSLKGVKTQPGKDRDEYPFAMTSEGGTGASIRLIDPSDNRGSGSTIGTALRGQPDGTQFEINFVP